jgi:thioredoxin 1
MIIEDKAELKSGKVLIDFWAEWCGPCRITKPRIENLGNETEDLKVYFCNVDSDSEMASAFGIRSIPTLVYLEDGEVKNRSVGVLSDQQLAELINP